MRRGAYSLLLSFPGKLAAITAAGVFLRALTSPWKIYHPDSGLYLLLAGRIAEGGLSVPMGSETGYYQPLFAAASSFFGIFTGNLEIAGCLVSVLAAGAAIVLTGLLARRTFGDTAAVGAALIVAFHPQMVHYGGLALTESLYTALLMGGVFIGWSALEKNSARRWSFSGAALGLAYLTRVAGIFEAVIPAIWAFASSKGRKRKIIITAAFIAGVLIFSAPYVVYLKFEQGSWRLTGQQGMMYRIISNPDKHERQKGKIDPETGRLKAQVAAEEMGTIEFLGNNAGAVVRRAFTRLDDAYGDLSVIFPPVFAAAMGLGLFGILRKGAGEGKPIGYLLSMWIPAVGLQAMTGTSPRYYVPLVPLGAIVAGRGIAHAFDMAGKKTGVAALLIVVIPLVASVKYGPDPDAEWVKPQRAAAEFIARQSEGRSVKVMTREPYVAFFANAERVPVPDEPLRKVLEYARRWDVDYLIADSTLIRAFHPQMAPLLNPHNAPPGWKPASMVKKEGRIIYIYKKEKM